MLQIYKEIQAPHHRTEGRLTKRHIQITYIRWSKEKLPRAFGRREGLKMTLTFSAIYKYRH